LTLGATLIFELPALAQTAIQYVYDDAGRLISVVDPAGDTAIYHYDAVGNVLSIDRHSSSQVSIISFSPGVGLTGTAVAIFGTGFSATPSQDAVTFNGTAATVSSASPTKLVVTVPAGATSGTIGVTAPAGSATSSMTFTVAAASTSPTITSFTPMAGVAGTSLTIAGTNFDTLPLNDRTSLNTQLTTVTAATSTSLTTSVPLLAGSGRITVSTPHGTATSAGDFIVPPWPYTSSDIVTSGRISFETATPVSVSTSNKIAMMLFDGTKGHRISLEGTSGTFATGAYLNILKPDGSALVNSYLYSNGFIDVATLPTTGTYTIVLNPDGTSTGSQALTLYSVPADFSGTITPGGSAVTATTTVPGQNGALTFSGSAGQRISLQSTSATFASGEWISILNPDASTLVHWFMYGAGFIDVMTLPSTGTYTIVVDPDSTSTGSLTLTLYDVPSDPTASLTIGGSSAMLTTTTPGQNALATFSGASGQQVTVHLTSNSMSWVTVTLLKPDGSQLTSNQWFTSSFDLSQQTLPATGTYSIKVDPSTTDTGSITVNVSTP
jgi:YD repeat-containing protein